MKDLIAEITRKVAEIDDEYKPKRGRPRKDRTPAQQACRARHKAIQKKKFGRLPTVEPWRCPICGHLILVEICLECQMEAKKQGEKTDLT